MPTTEQADVVIVGAGFAGLATARVCLEHGLSVVVLERRPGLEREGAGLALQPLGFLALERLGLVEEALKLGRPFTRVEQCDAQGRLLTRLDYAELDHPYAQMMTVSRAELIALLGETVPVRFGCELERIDGETVTYRTDGALRTVSARHVVGADGRASRTRELAGIRIWLRTRSEGFVVGLVDGPDLREDVARVYCGRGYADGVLPHPGRIYFFDYITPENRAAVAARDFAAWARVYRTRTPDSAHVLEHISSFDDVSVLAGRQHVALPRAKGPVVLAGDAAAAVHPHSGQGANFALDDGVALGHALVDDTVRVYARTQDRKRAEYVPYSVVAGRSMDGVTPLWRAARRGGVQVNRVRPLRRRVLARHVCAV